MVTILLLIKALHALSTTLLLYTEHSFFLVYAWYYHLGSDRIFSPGDRLTVLKYWKEPRRSKD